MHDNLRLPKNPLYRRFFLRTLSYTSSLGADTSECFQALQAASPLTPTTWLVAWSELASRLNQHAAALLDASPPQKQSAKLAYLRASNYHRTAFLPFFGHPFREEMVLPNYMAMRANFASAAKLFEPPLISLRIPYRGASLRGYLANPPKVDQNGRLIVVISGYDTPMEELYFLSAYHALSRGYSVVIFDGPGQGGTLLERRLKISPEFDQVLARVLDAAAERGTWKQTIMFGISIGGLLALEAVSSPRISSRVNAVVVDAAEQNLITALRSGLPFPSNVREQLPDGPAWVRWSLGKLLERKAGAETTGGWSLRRGMLVHGCDTPTEYMKVLAEFENGFVVEHVNVPLLIVQEQADTRSDPTEVSQAEALSKKLVKCEKKTLMLFRNEDVDGKHYQTGARMLFSERAFAWLDKTLL